MVEELQEELQEEFLNAQAQLTEVLDGWGRTGAVPPAAVEAARRRCQRLQVAMLQTLSDAAALEGRVARLVGQLQRVQAQQAAVAAAAEGGFQDAVEIVDKFREDRDHAAAQAAESADRAEAAALQLAALTSHRDGLGVKLAELEEEARAELGPQIKAARDEIDLLQESLRAERLKAQAAQQEVADVAARLEALQLEIRNLGRVAEEEGRAMAQSEKLPERCRRDADAAMGALRALGGEEEALVGAARELEVAESSWAQQAREVTAEQEAAARAGEKLRSAAAKKAARLDEINKDIEMAKLETEKHFAERVTLDLELEKRGGEAKRESEAVKSEQQARDVALRRLNKAELEGRAMQDQLPPLENSVGNMQGQAAALARQLVAEAAARGRLQAAVEGLVGQLTEEKGLTELQAALVKASLRDVQELDRECGEIKTLVAKRDKLAQEMASQRDAAGRQVSQWVAKLREALDAAEAKDGEVVEMKQQRGTVKVQQRELRGLCELMSEQMERYQGVCKSAQACVADLEGKVGAAEEQLSELAAASEARGEELRLAEKERGVAEAGRALLANRLAAARRERAGTLEEADHAALEVRRLQRAVEEGEEAARRLRESKAAAQANKEAAQQVLLGRDDEICHLYEQSEVCQSLMDEGTRALARCDDDIRLLQLEVAELQRSLFAMHKTAPDVTAYDRSIAQLKAEVFRARREAEELGATAEDPKCTPDRWRVLPGPIPSKDDLTDRLGQIDSKLGQRLNQIAQKDVALDELQRLIDSLVQKAAASHDGAFEISVQMNNCQRGLQAMTRRMMATVSELALYQALSIKYSADRETLRAAVAAARAAVAEGRPPTADAEKEYARLERDRAQQAEVRRQAAELRRLQEAGLLGEVPQRSTASPRPHAYLPDDEEGLPRPFLAPFQPFKPAGPPLTAAGAGPRRAAAGRGAAVSPTPPKELTVAPALA